jgi:uncharacterized phage protein (TIGR01671 family)
MNREFKFRVFDKRINKYIVFINDAVRLTYDSLVTVPISSKRYIIEQYIGSKDSNKKDIYEGDLIKLQWEAQADYVGLICKVVYYHNCFGLETKDKCLIPDSYYQFKHGKIVGSVLESPQIFS